MKRLLLLMSMTWMLSASLRSEADDWYDVVPYVCDPAQDEVRIRFFGDWNEGGLALLDRYAGADNLYRAVGPEDTNGLNWHTVRTCELSGGAVRIESRPVWPRSSVLGTGPCNELHGGIRVTVSFAGKEVGSYALEENCHADVVISAISIRGKDGRVALTRTDREDWYPK